MGMPRGEAATVVRMVGIPHISAGRSFVFTPVERRIGTTIDLHVSSSMSISSSVTKPSSSMPPATSLPAYGVFHAQPHRTVEVAGSHGLPWSRRARSSGA